MNTIIITDSKASFKVKQGNRSFDDNGYLCINNCVLTAAEVNDYLGKEISGWQQLGLDPNKAYGIYRPLEELKKAVDTYNLIPLTDNHIAISPEKPAREKWFGSSGESAKIEGNELLNTIKVWVGKAIQDIQAADTNGGGRKDLSCGYGYDLVQESGEFNGQKYDFIMKNIKANHVALVDDGRVSTAMIADSAVIKQEGVKKMVFSISKLLGRFMANDKKMSLDAAEKEEAIKGLKDEIKTIAKDVGMAVGGVDPEANENEQIRKLTQAVLTLHAIQSAENDGGNDEDPEADCNDEDPANDPKKADIVGEADDEKNEDDDPEEAAEKVKAAKKEAEAEKAMDARIAKAIAADRAVHSKVLGLCQNAIGKLSSDMIITLDANSLAEKVLKIKGVACDSKTLSEKIVMLETLNQTRVKPQVAADKKTVASAVTYKSNVIRR